jgi:hypothetical protein
MSQHNVMPCAWSATGYAYADGKGGCSCRIAAPPGVPMYDRDLRIAEWTRDRIIAESTGDAERVAELDEEKP